jgi:uncharacterized protein YifE (UPF0438 family)
MIKLLLTLIVKFIDEDYKRQRSSDDNFTIVIYQVTNKLGVEFSRIDIFTKENTNGEERSSNAYANERQRQTQEE